MPGQHGEDEREGEHPHVHGGLDRDGQGARGRCRPAERGEASDQVSSRPARPPEAGEQHALGEQLAHHAPHGWRRAPGAARSRAGARRRRDSIRFATFAQASSRTAPTTASSSVAAERSCARVRASPTSTGTVASGPLGLPPDAAAGAAAARLVSDEAACSALVPGVEPAEQR